MKPSKPTGMRLLSYVIIITLVVSGIWTLVKDLVWINHTQQDDLTATDSQNLKFPSSVTVDPQNTIQIGDSFECYPNRAEGHFLCTVTDVQLVTEADQCPPKEAFCDNVSLLVHSGYDEGPKVYQYEDWFIEGGAFDQGARIMLVDITVTNVDAVAWLSDGTLTETDGYFHDCDAFHSYSFVTTADMSKAEEWPDGSRVVNDWMTTLIYYSRAGEYYPEELHDTPGQELYALQIPIGQTVSFTLGYSIDGHQNRTAPELSDLWLVVHPGRNITTKGLRNLETSIFIDTKLGSEEE